MQNKSAIWVFTILLALACIYQLSFTWVTYSVESKAADVANEKVDSMEVAGVAFEPTERDSAIAKFTNDYLVAQAGVGVYPLFGHTYKYCKQREINRGLDLQGGMNVTLEVSVIDLIKAISNDAQNPVLRQALSKAQEQQADAQDDFVTLFANAYAEVRPNGNMTELFHSRDNKDMFPIDASNEEVINTIREEAEAAISRTEKVLRKRIDNLGVVQPKIQRLGNTGRIIVELPGVKDKSRVRKILQGTAKLEFWETHDNREISRQLEQANNLLARKLKPAKDTAEKEEAKVAPTTPDSNAQTQVNPVTADSNEAEDNSLEALFASGGTGDSTGDNGDTNDLGFGTASDDDSTQAVAQSAEEFRENNPLFALLRPAIEPNEQGSYVYSKGPTVGYASVNDTAAVNKMLKRKDVMSLFPRRIRFYWDAKAYDDKELFLRLWAINVTNKEGVAPLEGDAVIDAGVEPDPSGRIGVRINMNAEGSQKWRLLTKEYAQKGHIAIVLDNLVYSAPFVEGEIPTGNTRISGNFTQEEAADLANVLKAGKLPAPSKIIEEAVVGPTLGAEAVSSGLLSFLGALALILVYMIFYYSRAGAIADVALVANIFFVMGVLTSLGATLTLPGIAGIVLTIGMSVDANVLIYERIREELAAGKGLRLAIVDGYNQAYSSIIDANITTLLTGIILAIFGTGPIQGFATTLIIGICTSLFSAIFITRLLFEWRLEKNAPITFATKLTEGAFKNIQWGFIAKRKIFYFISGAIILGGVASLATNGLNYGVDFTGGRSYMVRFDQSVEVNDISRSLSAVFVDSNGLKEFPEVKTYGSDNQVKITTKHMINDKGATVDDQVEAKLYQGLKPYVEGVDSVEFSENYLMSSQKVGPTIADDIQQAAYLSVIFSLVIIFLYILFRFRKWQFGLGALVAMFHDVLVVLGIFSIFYSIMPFSMEIDQAFIAAILTVVGYSINDTVVVFDRIREYLGLYKRKEYDAVINSALNSTLSRTINTSLSTFVVLLMIFLFGGEVIRGFVFALMVGVVVGTYSSLCVATPIIIDFGGKKKEEKGKK